MNAGNKILKQSCPNYLFIEWLSAWQADAARKGLNSHHTYAKAIRSLQKYPLQLKSGKECIILEYFGPKLCQMLDDEIEKYKQANGPLSFPPPFSYVDYKKNRKKTVKKRTSDKSSSLVTSPNASQTSKSKCSVNYVPKYRSGPYALLITLYHSLKSGEASMSKVDLLRLAQNHCDSSFTVPTAGSRYTAWSSMGSLIKKEYVCKLGSPARYSLTSLGSELAMRMLNEYAIVPERSYMVKEQSSSAGGNEYISRTNSEYGGHINSGSTNCEVFNVNDYEIIANDSISSAPKMHETLELSDDDDALLMSDEEVPPKIIKVLSSDSDDNGVDAPVLLLENNLKLSTKPSTELSNKASNILNEKLVSSDSLVGSHRKQFNKDLSSPRKFDSAPDANVRSESNSLQSKSKCTSVVNSLQKSCTQQSKSKLMMNAIDIDSYPRLSNVTTCSLEPQVAVVSTSQQLSTESLSNAGSLSDLSQSFTLLQRKTDNFPVLSDFNSCITRNFITELNKASLSSNQENKISHSSNQQRMKSHPAISVCSATITGNLKESIFSLAPNTFDVILCVDSCELMGGSHSTTRQHMLTELSRLGVPFEMRKLNIGDFLWIAREKTYTADDKKKELVLDYIVERKRMDDLAGSICDGRFHEQKFRLKNCSVKNVIYLIEDYGKSQQHFSISEDALNQAIINTQVVDKFFVRRTRDIVDSAAYLSLLTEQLQQRYRMKFLNACTIADCNRVEPGYRQLNSMYPTFEEFNAASCKNKELTVREMFAKHLVQLHGLTTDKATSILKEYPTPFVLLQAYNNCDSDLSRHNLLTQLKCGPMKRNLGCLLSKQISQLYTQTSFT